MKDLVMETSKLYDFLLNLLIDVYRFPPFDIADEESFFILEFSKNSCVRKYSCVEGQQRIDGMMIHVSLEKDDVVSYKTFLTTNLAPNFRITNRCGVLGYKDELKVFATTKDVLEECLRVENSFVEVAPTDLEKSKGECSICNTETTLLAWPCYSTHTVCEECTSKIIEKNCVCPFCRSVLQTTVVPKEESNDCKFNDCKDDEVKEDDSDYESDNEYFDQGVNDEEKYFFKTRLARGRKSGAVRGPTRHTALASTRLRVGAYNSLSSTFSTTTR